MVVLMKFHGVDVVQYQNTATVLICQHKYSSLLKIASLLHVVSTIA